MSQQNPFANPFVRRRMKIVEPVVCESSHYDGWTRRWTLHYSTARHAMHLLETQFTRGKIVTVEGQSLVVESSTVQTDLNDDGRLTAIVVAASVTDILAGAGTALPHEPSTAPAAVNQPIAPLTPRTRSILL